MNADIGLSNITLAGAFVDELARSGLRHACVCPGSRSTPLAVSLARHEGIRVWIHVDERSAAFFALGMARVADEPVALLCSSGTAAANFLPAMVEANLSRVPLIVLTADRPPELRGFGAAQTIDQIQLYGSHVKWFVDMPVPESTGDLSRHARTVANRSMATALARPAGPVHLNFPFREPLLPISDASDSKIDPVQRSADMPFVTTSSASRAPLPTRIASLAGEVRGSPHGVIVCGPQDDPEFAASATSLAAATGYPILADPLSQVRCGEHELSHVVDSYDAFLRSEEICQELAPRIVLRFGAIPTSKPLLQYLQRFADCRQVLIDGDGGWRDPLLLVSEVLHADPRLVCDELVGSLQPGTAAPSVDNWLACWREIADSTRAAIATRIEEEEDLFEGRVFAELAALLPDRATLFAGNSMPVRDLDAFFPTAGRPLRFLANRGANGIDGVVSSALGVAAVNDAPVVLAIGDLSFYHDMNGLLAAKRHRLNATIVVLNNNGGGIFSFLPQAGQVEHDVFETLYGTPTDLDISAVARLYGASFAQPATWVEFREAVEAGTGGEGLTIIEVVTNRAGNVAQHRAVSAAVVAKLRDRATSGVA